MDGASPLSPWRDSVFFSKGLEVSIKRDDLIGGVAQGNKYRKMMGVLKEINSNSARGVLTFGGAYSNHLFAVAALGHEVGFDTIGIVRGKWDSSNPTLHACRQKGMVLEFVSRDQFKRMQSIEGMMALSSQYPECHILPMGGSGMLAETGLRTLADELTVQGSFDHIIVPSGTGATAVGLAMALPTQVLAMQVISRRDDFLLPEMANRPLKNLRCMNAARSGFAKMDQEVVDFCKTFRDRQGIFLDPIYTAKAMMKTVELAHQDYFNPGSKIVVIHTGGHQGIFGYNHRFGTQVPEPDSIF